MTSLETEPLLRHSSIIEISDRTSTDSTLIDPPELGDQDETLFEKIKALMAKFSEWIDFLSRFIPFVNRDKNRRAAFSKILRDEFEKNKLKIFIGTWNMHGKLPPNGLSPFIDFPHYTESDIKNKFYFKKNSKHPYHILVIGTQECQHNIKHSVFFPSKEEWEQRLKNHLGDEYVLVKTETMAALHLAVFVWARCKDWVKGYQHDEVPTGLANLFGNKGGIGISLLFGNTSFCFINSHLAAHQSKVKERNHDVKKISKELKLKGFNASDKVLPNVTDRFDYTFWFGDMNYRVNLSREHVEHLIAEENIIELLKHDQLTIELKQFPYFKNFHEAPIEFYPTFKFDTHKSSQDQRSQSAPELIEPIIETDIFHYDSSVKQRVPSWTDRILWKSKSDKKKVKLLLDSLITDPLLVVSGLILIGINL
ncbi:194_t:CDS:2 [Funneliformis geosporum]|uniref:2949_t:CDS:1 n=1 Tax=Funneliformis geosporum TaxID=1117311 RepID=A0A9W4SRK1_9GLOM|nr:2949_t:CDS:2 [Funneliformis geosporum]CAI2185608.1 194_t:CDS:2 [Funneliformis geosporum]